MAASLQQPQHYRLHRIRIHRMLKPCAGMTERERAGRGGGNGLGAQHGEIPAASAGMTDLFARV